MRMNHDSLKAAEQRAEDGLGGFDNLRRGRVVLLVLNQVGGLFVQVDAGQGALSARGVGQDGRRRRVVRGRLGGLGTDGGDQRAISIRDAAAAARGARAYGLAVLQGDQG